MTERQALAEALKIAKEIRRDQLGKAFPGRTHKLREVQIPKLLRVLRQGLGLEVSDGTD